MEPFLKHPDMKLSINDISYFVANFDDKAKNLEKIQNYLNVGYDSMVFVDDSKIECEWVKEKLPEVTTINLKGEPSQFVTQIDRLGLFNIKKITQEDKNRVKTFRTKRKFEIMKTDPIKLQDFLKNLEPNLIIEKINPYYSDRAEQLILKTNQFKINKKIYSKLEIEKNENNFIAFRFKDNLNDYGIVVILSLYVKKPKLEIGNWVMSCRVFERDIENSVLGVLKKFALKNNCDKISIKFVDNTKNKPALNAIKKIGFEEKSSNIFEFSCNKKIKNDYIKIKNFERIFVNDKRE